MDGKELENEVEKLSPEAQEVLEKLEDTAKEQVGDFQLYIHTVKQEAEDQGMSEEELRSYYPAEGDKEIIRFVSYETEDGDDVLALLGIIYSDGSIDIVGARRDEEGISVEELCEILEDEALNETTFRGAFDEDEDIDDEDN